MKHKDSLELAKIKIQMDIIQNCIRMSKQIIVGTNLLNSLRNAEFFVARFPFVLPSSDKLKELRQETEIRIYDLKRSISISLRNLIREPSVTIEDLFWFSTNDLKSGYILFYPHVTNPHPNYVLFLVRVKDSLDGSLYLPGTIKQFRHINHTLTDIKGLSERELGLAISCVGKSEILNNITMLKRSLNSKSNE